MEIYLDHSATTPCSSEAVEACRGAMADCYGNPSSLHRKGFAAERLTDAARESIAAALACDGTELIFTSGATEANNLALIGAARARERRGKTIVISAVEHPSVLEPAAWLEKQGFTVKRIFPGADGVYSPADFAEAMDQETVLVSAMMVNNETGLILPVLEIAKAVKRMSNDVLFHTDAVQGFLKQPIRLKNSMIDLLSVSGHKVRAPKGVGALYIRKGVRLLPLLYGGGQQNGLRPGTEPVPLIAAFGAAVEAQKGRIAENAAHYETLRSHLVGCLSGISGVEARTGGEYAPWIVSVSAYGLRSEILLHYLEEAEIYVSSGSACSKGAPSHVLSALGIDRRTADETIRVSMSAATTVAELDAFAERLAEAMRLLHKQR